MDVRDLGGALQVDNQPTSGYPRTPIRVRSSTINSDLGPLFIYASIGIPWGIGADREVVFVRRTPP